VSQTNSDLHRILALLGLVTRTALAGRIFEGETADARPAWSRFSEQIFRIEFATVPADENGGGLGVRLRKRLNGARQVIGHQVR
jgi:hypothetical protein